jgi:hypothetical protein
MDSFYFEPWWIHFFGWIILFIVLSIVLAIEVLSMKKLGKDQKQINASITEIQEKIDKITSQMNQKT